MKTVRRTNDFNKKIHVLAFVWIFAGTPVCAQDSTLGLRFGEPCVTAVLKAFEGYNDALVSKNYTKLRQEFLYAPFAYVGQPPQVITEIDVIVASLRRTRDSLDADGYETSKVINPHISVLSSNTVLLNCRLKHYGKNGSLLLERANFYLLIKAAGAWKIAGFIPQDPAYADKLY